MEHFIRNLEEKDTNTIKATVIQKNQSIKFIFFNRHYLTESIFNSH